MFDWILLLIFAFQWLSMRFLMTNKLFEYHSNEQADKKRDRILNNAPTNFSLAKYTMMLTVDYIVVCRDKIRLNSS